MVSKTIYKNSAKTWTEAIPLGNGSLGAMVFGGVESEKICLNHDTLWSGVPRVIKKEGAYESFMKTKAYALEGKYAEAHREISDNFLSSNTENYLPLGDMLIDFHASGETENYLRVLDLSRAIHTVTYSKGGIDFKREYFLSFPDDVLVIRLTASKPHSLSFDLKLVSQLKSSVTSESTSKTLYLDGECPGYSHSDDPNNIQEYEYSDEPEKKGIAFRCGVRILAEGGKTVFSDVKASVTDADSAILVFSAKTSFNGYDKHPFLCGKEYIAPLARTLDGAASKSYDTLLSRHTEDYEKLYSRVSLYLGESGREEMPTDERLKSFGVDGNDISLYVLIFDFGRYLTIASSRQGSQATNLQGIWNASLTPPWRCNYTVNINTEMNYFPTLMCGLEPCFEPLIRFMKDRSVAGEETAKHYYHAHGFVMHHNSDIWAHTTAVTNDAQWGFWNGSSGWLCHNLYEYYEYTLDKDYLSQVCFPIMKKAAEFYLDLLCDRGDGRYSICPATSPENAFLYDGGKRSSVAKYSTMSDGIACELFVNCEKALKELDITDSDSAFATRLDFALSHMSPFAIDSTGRLLEWNGEFTETERTHRHVSHLYALHPAHLITPEGTPELAEACRKTLEERGDAGTGWSLGWKINFFARLNEGDHALKLIDMQLHYVESDVTSYLFAGGTYPNLFDAHPPFQIDGNFGAVSGILEMLVDTRLGQLKLLPALPSKWKNGKLCGVRVKGGKILDIEWENGKLKSVKEMKAEK